MRNYLDDIQKLHALFNNNFIEVYRAANPNKRRSVLPYLQSIYRRWLYSSLIEDAPLSPANLIESICRYYNMPVSMSPVAYARNKSKFTSADMRLVEYSLDNHPMVDDMRLLIDYCTPHVDLQAGDNFALAQAIELADRLSLNDIKYAAFLLEISLEMRLIAKIPSVGVSRFRPSPYAGEVMDASCKDIFLRFVDVAVTLASRGLQNLVMLPETLFTPTFIRSLLEKPMFTDDIFAKVYDALGYDLDDVMDFTMEEGSLESLDVDLLAGTFMTGVLLDKTFFTPFGHFMKVIRPLYILPFEFGNEVTDFINVNDDPEEGAIAFYAPCSSYTLTDLGLECLGLEPTPDNYINIAEALPFAQMKDTLFGSQDALAVFAEIAKHLSPLRLEAPPEDILTFRARLEKDTAIWAHVQMPSDANLHDMYVEVSECLGIKDNSDYTFYHDKTENPFAEYTSPRRMKRGRKTADTMLDELDFEHQKHMLMVAYNQALPFGGEEPTTRVQLELLHVKPPEFGYEYPRISRVSKGLRDSYGF